MCVGMDTLKSANPSMTTLNSANASSKTAASPVGYGWIARMEVSADGVAGDAHAIVQMFDKTDPKAKATPVRLPLSQLLSTPFQRYAKHVGRKEWEIIFSATILGKVYVLEAADLVKMLDRAVSVCAQLSLSDAASPKTGSHDRFGVMNMLYDRQNYKPEKKGKGVSEKNPQLPTRMAQHKVNHAATACADLDIAHSLHLQQSLQKRKPTKFQQQDLSNALAEAIDNQDVCIAQMLLRKNLKF